MKVFIKCPICGEQVEASEISVGGSTANPETTWCARRCACGHNFLVFVQDANP